MDNDLRKRAYFQTEARTVVETKPTLAPIATKLITKALSVFNPITSVTAAKNSTALCVNAVGTATISKDTITIDRRVSNSIKVCDEDLSYANFNQTEAHRADLYASVVEKLNKNAAIDLVAEATDGTATTEDLSTDKKVRDFLLKVKNEAGRITSLSGKVDGARAVRSKFHNKPVVVAGTEAFATIQSSVAGQMALSTIKGIEGNVIETPYGVLLIRDEKMADNKQLVYGTAGAFIMAHREDNLKVDMVTIDALTTAGANDVDISSGDEIYQKTTLFTMAVMTKNKVFSNVKSLLTQKLMA